MTLLAMKSEILAAANETKAKVLSGFFKTGKGSYGEGDIFIGVTVPANRTIVKKYLHLSPTELLELLHSEIHELRLAALLCMVEQYKSRNTSDAQRELIVDTYIANTRYINNWDLVDLSVYNIIGAHLLHRNRELLYQWADSDFLWEQRMSIVATIWFIRNGQYDDTLSLAERLCQHPHDLIQKAVGWTLREVGKRDEKRLTDFLDKQYTQLPRTLLRYAIERLTPQQREYYMRK